MRLAKDRFEFNFAVYEETTDGSRTSQISMSEVRFSAVTNLPYIFPRPLFQSHRQGQYVTMPSSFIYRF